MAPTSPVRELRVALRVDDFDQAVAFYRDALGLPEVARYDNPDGRVSILAAGHATLELLSPDQVDVIDRVEVGHPADAGRVRLALEVADSAATADALGAAGAVRLGGPVLTPWQDRNVRVRAPDGIQLTLFTPEPDADAPGDGDVDLAPFLDEAIALAVANVADGQLPFGAVAVEGGRVVATGVNTSLRDGDPTAHAETAAMRAVITATGRTDLGGITVVSSAQPCPVCMAVGALVGVDRIVYAAPRGLAERFGFLLPRNAARLAAAWTDDDLVHHAETPTADRPFRAYADRIAGDPS
jgi:tRNA(Arg) A34 adenosine deaminase TadA/catechol 2,3-dioxygenase-like lactoylglutathione lyase family enzyme